jgi:hypothetical protein
MLKQLIPGLLAFSVLCFGQGDTHFVISGSSGGSGTVTSIATGCGLTGGTITTSGTVSQSITTVAHNGSYAVLTGDCGTSITTNTAAAWTIAQSGTTGFAAGWFVAINNVGAGALTLTATTSTFYGGPTANISGSVLTIPAHSGATIVSDGTNYQVYSISPGTVTSVATTSPLTGGTITGAGTIACATCTVTIANGTASLGTSAIASGACATVVTSSATGVATTDNIMADFNSDPTAVTGYSPSVNGMLSIIKYPTSNNVNFKVCNNTGSSVTPGAITLNWRVTR